MLEMSAEHPKIIAVIGPTGSGKTKLGVFLAQQFKGKIVSADAKQVYRGMDIGTAKEKDLPVKQHLIDIKHPGEKITVAEYQALAYGCIDQLLSKGVLPILVGGSGLYAEAVLNGYQFAEQGKSQKQAPKYQSLKLGIQVDREELRRRIVQRTEEWLEQGIVREIESLLKQGVSSAWLEACGLEYRYFTHYLRGELSLEEAIRKTNSSQNQFIKRQYTWWRRHSDVHWVSNKEEAEKMAREFLASR